MIILGSRSCPVHELLHVAGHRVVKQQEVRLVQTVDAPQQAGVHIAIVMAEVVCCAVVAVGGATCRERHQVVRVDGTQHVLCISIQVLVLPNEVILQHAWVAKVNVLSPVLVQRHLPAAISQVVQELCEPHIGLIHQVSAHPVFDTGSQWLVSEALDDEATELLFEVLCCGRLAHQLVPVG